MTTKEALEVINRMQISITNSMVPNWIEIEALTVAKGALEREIKSEEKKELEGMNKAIEDLVCNRTDQKTSMTPIGFPTKDEEGRPILLMNWENMV